MALELSSSVQLKLPWRTSSYSGGGNDCVEVAPLDSGAVLRDTKAREMGMLTVSGKSWRALLATVRAEELR
jgi:hypothetical protein